MHRVSRSSCRCVATERCFRRPRQIGDREIAEDIEVSPVTDARPETQTSLRDVGTSTIVIGTYSTATTLRGVPDSLAMARVACEGPDPLPEQSRTEPPEIGLHLQEL